LKRTLKIENEPDKVNRILTSLKKDNHLSKTFEGSAKNGYLTGFYTQLALINGMVIGYVKIKGQYLREKGNLKLEVIPSNLYWVVIAFDLIAITILTYKGITEDKIGFIGSFLFLIIALIFTIAYKLESKSFLKHIERISKLNDE
jgi:hypothetical protein